MNNKYRWTERDPKGPATEPVELVAPDGKLTGLTLRTLVTGWGNYQDGFRDRMEAKILKAFNEEDGK